MVGPTKEKGYIMETRNSRRQLLALLGAYVLLGVALLGVSGAVYFGYERSGSSEVISAQAVPDLRSMIRYLAFGILPPVALTLLVLPFGLRGCLKRLQVDT